ncbi:prion-inhibition and propagation-domain-containing protein [Hypoxylon cercidicola]|nr:prion-inhibition and propagation-domain-containing protein [Hypoxylon cercidicola]
MAETAGLVVGVATLIGTFKDCVDLFLYIDSARSITGDYEVLETKLEIERTLFLQWADRVRLLSPDQYDRRLDDTSKSKVLSATLGSIRQLLNESQKYCDRYGLILQPERELCNEDCQIVSGRRVTTQAASAISGPRLIRFIEDFEKRKISSKDRQSHVSPIGKFCWAIKDKDKFGKLIQELSYFITKLNELVPDNANHVAAMINDDLKEKNLRILNLIYDASINNEHTVAAIAERNRWEKRVLRSLWFRTIDERRYSVELPHSKTLSWTLEPREALENDIKWDNLSEWLQTGTGIYWVSGKAGSGKSTLMKYVHGHQRTRSLLEQWAAGCPLTMVSFFFWYAGTDEQKTQDGISRALLFYILKESPADTQNLLPSVWQEAKVSESDEIRPPSAAEMRHAFEQLSSGHTKIRRHKFCFLIDGLDEYLGDIREGISFIKNLAEPKNIKLVVSSRPIPACVDAFSDKPQLHLQDLTKADMASYVDAEVNSHPYMSTLRRLDPVNAPKIVEELVGKASGVFLWIVLACRSVLEGFASHDHVLELLQRVDELPPELEDLFSHMLGRVDPRYQGQCAKLLRTCYQNKLVPGAPPIRSIGLALADYRDRGLLQTVKAKDISIGDRLLMCEAFERRLGSHCRGLLEFARTTNVRTERYYRHYCFCDAELEHDATIDSTVDFMHRTVFEFLNDPGTWQLDCLQIRDKGYEPHSFLANISLQVLEMVNNENELYLCMEEVITYASLADHSSTGTNCPITPVLMEFEKMAQRCLP